LLLDKNNPAANEPLEPVNTRQLIFAFVLSFVLLVLPSVLVTLVAGLVAKVAGIAEPFHWVTTLSVQLYLMPINFLLSLVCLAKIISHGTYHWQSALKVEPLAVKDSLLWCVCAAAFWLLMMLVSEWLSLPEQEFMLLFTQQDNSLLLTILVISIGAPLVEEVVMRGYLFHHCQRYGLSMWLTILLSSIAFGLLHVSQYTWVAVVQVILLGCYLGWVRIKANNTSVAILTHATFNSLTLIAIYNTY